jgi:hypothetical protein
MGLVLVHVQLCNSNGTKMNPLELAVFSDRTGTASNSAKQMEEMLDIYTTRWLRSQ